VSRFPYWYSPPSTEQRSIVGAHGVIGEIKGWDLAVINGVQVNGKALLTGLDVQLKIDPRKKKGANAAKPTTHGLDVSEGSLRIAVWTRDQMDDVDALLATICPPVNLEPVTLDHPQARTLISLLGKLDVLVKGCSPWEPSSVVRRGYEVKLKLLHWPAAQRVKGKSETPQKPKNALLDKIPFGTGFVSPLLNPMPTLVPGYASPPVSATGS
jgi:hypothetical protein